MLSRSAWHEDWLPIVMADISVLLANYAFYVGFCLTMGLRPRLGWIQALFGLSLPVLLYFTTVQPNASLRWSVIVLVTAPMHLLLAAQAIRHRDFLLARKLLAFIEFVTGIGALQQGFDLLLRPMSEQSPGPTPAQTVAMFLLLSHACGVALCGFMAAYARLAVQADQYALQDAIPGVLNRKGIERRLDECIEDAHRHTNRLVIAMIDLDHFKQVNDHHGHAAGDAALAYLARTLTRRLRSSDAVGRFGGDEFLIVMPNARASFARHVLEAVRMEVRGRPDLPFTISCGGAVAEKGDTAETLLKRADENLYRVKHSGRDGVSVEACPS